MNIADLDPALLTRIKKIQLLVLDVDGVLSDGRLYFSNSGEELKAFNTLDGQGIKMLQKSGVKVAVITGRSSEIVARRTQALGIEHVIQGREDKWTALEELRQQLPIDYDAIAHMGDDYPDLPLIKQLGLGLTVADAHWAIKEHAHWQSERRGGEGAVREACDLIMLAQGTFEGQLAPYLEN